MNADSALEVCDLCVIGAGVAGLNALAVAREYLPKSARVIVVDRRAREGGMWVDTYDYVRLHQPHRMFTAGDLPWKVARQPAYLADKPEVLAHLSDCLTECRESYQLEEFFGFEFLSLEELEVEGQWRAKLTLKNQTTGELREVLTDRCVKAYGFRVPMNPPLTLQARHVHSISPHGDALFGDKFASSTAPCFIVGGGKTAMDTAITIINKYPNKQVSMLVGRGTVFLNRDKTFHKGVKRWFGGETTRKGFLNLGLRYNGDNDQEVMDYFKKHMGIYLDDSYENYFFGILSEQENELLKSGLHAVYKEYLEDITDDDGQALMHYRSGGNMSIPKDSWIINCTGYIARQEYDYEPYVSAHATTISIQPSSGIHFLSTFGAYFLTHLLFLDKLPKLQLYELDYQSLMRKNKAGFALVGISHTLYNILVMLEEVPTSVFTRCGLDFDNWFPFYRRLLGGIDLRRHNLDYRLVFKHALDRVREKYQIRCGELDPGPG